MDAKRTMCESTCRCCRRPKVISLDLDITMYNLRGLDGTPYTGRVITKGSTICDDCAENMESF